MTDQFIHEIYHTKLTTLINYWICALTSMQHGWTATLQEQKDNTFYKFTLTNVSDPL